MTRNSTLLAAATALALAGPVDAAEIARTLTFEGLTEGQQVSTYYDGITFGERAIASIDRDARDGTGRPLGFGNFANEPTGDTVLDFFYHPGTERDMPFTLAIELDKGFNSRFELYYSKPRTGASVQVFNAAGELLASTVLGNTATNQPGDPTGGTDFGQWNLVSLELAPGDMATRVELSGQYGRVLFDNLSFVSLPEPSTYLLMALGVAAVGAVARRRRD